MPCRFSASTMLAMSAVGREPARPHRRLHAAPRHSPHTCDLGEDRPVAPDMRAGPSSSDTVAEHYRTVTYRRNMTIPPASAVTRRSPLSGNSVDADDGQSARQLRWSRRVTPLTQRLDLPNRPAVLSSPRCSRVRSGATIDLRQ